MPNPNLPFGNNSSDSNYPSSILETMSSSSTALHSSQRITNDHTPARKSLLFPQLYAIYSEIVNRWSEEKWLTFADNQEKTYLTLDSHTTEFLTVQMAMDQYYLTSGRNSLLSPPDCLLIRTKSKSKNSFLPNSIISLENLCDNNAAQGSVQYKLMAMICHSNETHSKLMFYKDFQSDSWYIYYDQSISSHSHSNILSNEQQFQLESLIQQKNHIDLFKLTSPLSALSNHPIVYVYIPEKSNKNN